MVLKSGTRDFHNSPPVERSACFYVIINGIFSLFQYFSFGTNFLENENFFKNLEYSFLIQSTKIKNASFPYKTAISEADVKTNRMMSTK